MPTDPQERNELINSVALLVLDAQDCFIDTLSDKERFLSRCAFVIDAARILGIRTLFTEQVPNKLGHSHARLFRRAQSPRVFHKQSFSALNAPGIERYLRDNEVYHLIVCGLETPICVYQTGLQAVDEDIDITFLADALGCRRSEDAPYALETLRGMGCQVLPSESLFYSLLGDVTHPSFKAFNELVKAFSDPSFDLESYLESEPVSAPATPSRDSQKTDDSGDKRNKRRRSRGSRRGRRREEPSNAADGKIDSHKEESTPTSSDSKPAQDTAKKSPKPPAQKTAPRKRAKADDKDTAKAPIEHSPEPAKKAAKKAARKTPAKKAAKKAAKKVAKKAARKKAAPAKDSSSAEASSNS